MDLSLESLGVGAADLDVELCEHKGIGHPDTICDALAERLSVALSRHYLDRFGAILHHNVDKALLRGGASRPAFGGGEVVAPIEIFVAGRATVDVDGAIVPVDAIFEESARSWLGAHLHALDPARHVVLRCLVRPGSADLVDVFRRRAGERLANDTSLGAGYAPLSPLESTVLAAARELRAMAADPTSPEVGEDVKVMGVRHDAQVRLTIACAFIGRHLPSLAAYAERRHAVAARVLAAARREGAKAIEVEVNAGDDLSRGSVYLTVTGTSAEAGDDGQVGRGNRVNGLITPYRPMTLEAAAGKNPVTHVGKLYNLAARSIAEAIVAALPEIAEAQCQMVSRIGHPIQDPALVHLRVRARDGGGVERFAAPITRIVRAELEGIEGLARRVLDGAVRVY